MNILQFHPPVHLAAQEVSDVCPINTTSSTINTIDGLTDYSLLLNGLVSMLTYFSMSLAALENEVGIRQCRPINLPGRQFFADLNSAKVRIFFGVDSC
jgi:hypothetical protein